MTWAEWPGGPGTLRLPGRVLVGLVPARRPAARVHVRRLLVGVVVVGSVVAGSVAGGCTGPAPAAPVSPAPSGGTGGWSVQPLPPEGARVLRLIPVGTGADGLLAAGSVPAGADRAPAVWLTGPLTGGRITGWQAVGVRPVTGYGQVAEFVDIATAAGVTVAFGQAFGGAHGNPRPTLWAGPGTDGLLGADSTRTGSAGIGPGRAGTGGDALVEHEQPFELLGGPRAVGTGGLAAGPDGVLMIGQWDRPDGGPGGASWLSPDGVTWTRVDDDPALRSTPSDQVRPRHVAGLPGGYLAVGDVERHGGPVPMAWSSPDGRRWRATPLPLGAGSPPGAGTSGSGDAGSGDAGSGSAARVACTAAGCLAFGVLGGALGSGAPQRVVTWWQPAGGGWSAPATVATAGGGDLLEPLDAALGAGGEAVLLLRAAATPRIYLGRGPDQGWTGVPLPTVGDPVAVAVTTSVVLVAGSTGLAARAAG
jgi:hypothetical protein